MHLIKLDEVDSTNTYLKILLQEKFLENFTTIFTENQIHGKGQMGNQWVSEKDKNLTFSTLVTFPKDEIVDSVNFNMMVAVSIVEALEKIDLKLLAIKWPNDILLHNKKICGILIEQTKNLNQETSFVVGIGLNISQTNFENLPKASSIEKLTSKKIDKNLLLIEIINQLKTNWIKKVDFKEKYLQYLYQFQNKCTFKLDENLKNGKIIDITSQGLLVVEFENETRSFGIKDIEMVY